MNELHKKIIKGLLDDIQSGARGDMVSTILGHDESDKDDNHPLNASKEKTENVHGDEDPTVGSDEEPELDAYGYPVEDEETPHEDSEDCKCKDCKAKS
jgi:hypothetical protein